MKSLFKNLIVLIFILTASLTVCGQEVELPKRIILKGDSGVFFTKKQETVLIYKLNYIKTLERQVDSLENENQKCSVDLKASEISNEITSKRKDELYQVMNSQDSIIKGQERIIDTKENEIRKWKKTTLCTGVVAVGCVLAGVTGAWLPALTVIAVTEAAIIFTKREK
jgi:hypothetical protein